MKPLAVEAKGIHLRHGRIDILRDVNMAVPEGAFVAIIGPNGAGKTSLLHVLLGLESPTSGEALLFNSPPGRLAASALGYVPQVKTLDRSFPAKAAELVATGIVPAWPWKVRASIRREAVAAMERCGIENLADRPIPALSGGELQRVYLARCLVRRPKLLILDEPAAGMDLGGEADMYHFLCAYQKETAATILMITHDWEGARVHADLVLLLDRGLAAFGPPEETANEARLLRVFGHAGHRRDGQGAPHA